jgi:ubiquitin-like domain-containing CTD phosphatase 1
MLSKVYQHYEIVIWSQTSWRWLEAKITELGMLHHPDYKISFVLDQSSMFSMYYINTYGSDGKKRKKDSSDGKKKNEDYKHQVKPLALIWKKFSQFSDLNTIHIDDLSRNFAMNPQSGLKITAFKNAPMTRDSDTELIHLTKYLLQIR